MSSPALGLQFAYVPTVRVVPLTCRLPFGRVNPICTLAVWAKQYSQPDGVFAFQTKLSIHSWAVPSPTSRPAESCVPGTERKPGRSVGVAVTVTSSGAGR